MTVKNIIETKKYYKKVKELRKLHKNKEISTSLFWGEINILKNNVLNSSIPIKNNLAKILLDILEANPSNKKYIKISFRKYYAITKLYLSKQK